MELSDRITVREFRKRYFAQGSRPSERQIIDWITRGTQEKIFLRATRLDGVYYVTIGDAEAFLRASTAKENTVKVAKSKTHARSVAYLRAQGMEI